MYHVLQDPVSRDSAATAGGKFWDEKERASATRLPLFRLPAHATARI